MRFDAVIVGVILPILIAHGALAKDDLAKVHSDLQEISDPNVKTVGIRTLNEYLQNIGPGAKIRNCSILLWSRRGRVEDMFGGVCELQTGHSVALCGDTGIGEFGLNENVVPTKEAVADFVRNNCPG